MEKDIICINCPMGCRLKVYFCGENVNKVEGHLCKHGEEYARQEAVCPKRMLTSLMMPRNRKKPISVKTVSPIPKERFFDCVKQIINTHPEAPLACGDIVIKNICDTGVDVVVTRNIE
jgi:CxxC motif-containing protein